MPQNPRLLRVGDLPLDGFAVCINPCKSAPTPCAQFKPRTATEVAFGVAVFEGVRKGGVCPDNVVLPVQVDCEADIAAPAYVTVNASGYEIGASGAKPYTVAA